MESVGSITLLEAVGQYANNTKSVRDQIGAHQELSRFVTWCGATRSFSEIKPPEIEEYVDRTTGARPTAQKVERLQVVRRFLSYAKKKGMTDVNLAQHVRIRKAGKRANRGSGKEGPEPVGLTSIGYKHLVADLERLKAERAPIAEAIRSAAADKDVRENAPLEAAREQLGHVESRITDIEDTLKASVIIDKLAKTKAKTVSLGSRVVIRDLSSDRRTTYTIVSRQEANSLELRISDVSPVGKALVGCRVGQDVEVDTPRGRLRYRIEKVSR